MWSHRGEQSGRTNKTKNIYKSALIRCQWRQSENSSMTEERKAQRERRGVGILERWDLQARAEKSRGGLSHSYPTMRGDAEVRRARSKSVVADATRETKVYIRNYKNGIVVIKVLFKNGQRLNNTRRK